MMTFFPSDAAAWARLRAAGLVVSPSEADPPGPMAPAGPPEGTGTPVLSAAPALADRKVEVKSASSLSGVPAVSPTAEALGRYGQAIADAVASGGYRRAGQAEVRVSALGTHLDALLRAYPAARSADWLGPALQATARCHPAHREQALQQILRPALSSTLKAPQFQASMDSIVRSLASATTEDRRVTFAVLVKLMAMPHRAPADALALLEAARGFRQGIAYDDAALLVGAALGRTPPAPAPPLEPVVAATLALLDPDNQVAVDQEPIVNLGIELGRQARRAASQELLQVLLDGVAAVAPRLRPDQLWELARGCLCGLGGTQVELAQRDAFLACVLGLDDQLAPAALHGLWEGVGLGLLVEGAPVGGFAGALEVQVQRSRHMAALVAAMLERAGSPHKAAAILAGAAAASNKLHDGPGTLGDLLQRVSAAQSRLPLATAFTVGGALAKACWMVKDAIKEWDAARPKSGPGPLSDGDPAVETKSHPKPIPMPTPASPDSKSGRGGDAAQPLELPDPVGAGWRFVLDPSSLAGGAGDRPPGLPQVELATLAWSLPGVPGEQVLARHLGWLARAALPAGERLSRAVQLLADRDGAALRQAFHAARDLLLQVCVEARAAPGPATGHRPVVLQAMTQLMLAYDQWLTDPDALEPGIVAAHRAQVKARKDLPPDLHLMILERLKLHLSQPSDTKA